MKKCFLFILFLTMIASHSPSEEMTVECLGHWGGVCYDIALYKDYVCIGEGPCLTILDVKDPADPILVNSIMLKGIITNIYCSGDFVYVTHYGENGFQILELSDPAAPRKLGYINSEDFPRNITEILVKDGFAYIADGTVGIWIIDVRDPNHPIFFPTPTETSHPKGICIYGNYLYVADFTAGGLRIFEIGFPTPEAPSLIPRGRIDTPGEAHDISATSGTVFLAEGGILRIYNVSDPDNPSFITECVDPQKGNINHVEVRGHQAFFYGSSALLIFDVTNREEPVLKSNTTIWHYFSDCAIKDHTLFTIGSIDGLLIVDIENPSSPVSISKYQFSGMVYNVKTFDNRAFLANGITGFWILKVNNPKKIQDMYIYDSSSFSSRLFYKDGYAYVANLTKGLKIFDVRAHVPPGLLSTFKQSYSTIDVFVQENLAYLACQHEGIMIIDVSSPAIPVFKGACDTPGTANEICVSGNFAYVADSDGGLQIVNVTDPIHPTLAGDFQIPNNKVFNVCYYKNLVYLSSDYGMYIVDPINPAKPELIGTYLSETPTNRKGLSVVCDYVFIKNEGLQILDVSDPSSPTLVTTISLPRGVSDIDIHFNQGLAYVATSSGGLYILGFSKIPNPHYIKNLILGRDVPASDSVLDINKDFKVDISDMTTIMNPELDPVSEP